MEPYAPTAPEPLELSAGHPVPGECPSSFSSHGTPNNYNLTHMHRHMKDRPPGLPAAARAGIATATAGPAKTHSVWDQFDTAGPPGRDALMALTWDPQRANVGRAAQAGIPDLLGITALSLFDGMGGLALACKASRWADTLGWRLTVMPARCASMQTHQARALQACNMTG